MIRLPLIVAAVAGAAAAVVPAILGLNGNPSFSEQLPVRPPAHVKSIPAGDDHGARDGRRGDDDG